MGKCEDEAWKKYEKAKASAQKVYDNDIAPALEAYYKAKASALEAYKKDIAKCRRKR